ncbi:GNAT family N-acetyltransferase [Microbacterium paludicola]|nr:GNAT family N-acetyltransferase [Microbacterium paludicola]MBF0815003.1 GNAT family N-acetyltransferase [Microbacterium paludicola]
MTPAVVVRAARPEDARAMARVHALAWQETYRGLMRDEVLDAPDAVERRERMWTNVLTRIGGSGQRAAVADRDGAVVGIALAGPPEGDDAPQARQLYLIYLLAAEHGSGVGGPLLEAVLAPTEGAFLWVADPNPRAQAFYRRHGFTPDGRSEVDDGVREIRMIRAAS